MNFENAKTKWFAGLLLVGSFCVMLALFFILKPRSQAPQQTQLGQIEVLSGKVHLLRNELGQNQIIDQKAILFSLDSVETMDLAEASLNFQNGYQIKILENALVTVEQPTVSNSENTILLVLKRGEIKVEKFGRNSDLMIAKNGERISASDYNSSPLAMVPTNPPPSTTVPLSGKNPPPSEAEISQVMSEHKNSFYKCYTQVLQQNQQAKGEVSISFVIQNTGKLTGANVTRSEIDSANFKKCLLDVLSRIEFRSFEGQEVATYFPLRFE